LRPPSTKPSLPNIRSVFANPAHFWGLSRMVRSWIFRIYAAIALTSASFGLCSAQVWPAAEGFEFRSSGQVYLFGSDGALLCQQADVTDTPPAEPLVWALPGTATLEPLAIEAGPPSCSRVRLEDARFIQRIRLRRADPLGLAQTSPPHPFPLYPYAGFDLPRLVARDLSGIVYSQGGFDGYENDRLRVFAQDCHPLSTDAAAEGVRWLAVAAHP